MIMKLGPVGIWSSAWSIAFRNGDTDQARRACDAAAELEALGYHALWMGGSPGVDFAARVIEATSTVPVITGILSIWDHDAATVAAQTAELERRRPGRFTLGLGVSHPHATGEYQRPYHAMADYLTALDQASEPVPAERRVLAALGPKMLALSRDRAAGAHPYLVTVQHTAYSRETLGPDALLAPELKVLLVDTDIERARGTARAYLANYLAMPNYVSNLRRSGFGDGDLRDGGSDRLIDAVFALGDEAAIAARVDEFRAAGADHVCVQVVTDQPRGHLPLEEWRRLTPALLSR